jgi:imidazolonepropionase-like amidohydrolase
MPEEITLLHNAGMTKFEALAAATINGAVLLDLDDKVGSLEAGKLADFIVLSRNPLEDLSALEDITYVVFNGSFYDIKALDNIVPRCSIYIQGW